MRLECLLPKHAKTTPSQFLIPGTLVGQQPQLFLFGLQVLEFCKSYRDLLSMGFPPELVAGALMRNRDDLTAATEACLSAQSTQ